jgi:hypothetical protein
MPNSPTGSGRRQIDSEADHLQPPPGGEGVPGRYTVTITGLGAEGYATRRGTRPSNAERHRQVKRHEREGFRPDRVVLWAVLLGVMLILAATASSHAAGLPARHAGPPPATRPLPATLARSLK